MMRIWCHSMQGHQLPVLSPCRALMVLSNEAGCDIGRLEERQVGTISDGNCGVEAHASTSLASTY